MFSDFPLHTSPERELIRVSWFGNTSLLIYFFNDARYHGAAEWDTLSQEEVVH